MSRRHADETEQGDMVAPCFTDIASAWRRQIESKDSSYHSPHTAHSIWTDRVTKADRSPGTFAARDVNRHQRDCLGNRVVSDTKAQQIRAALQRLSVLDKDFACVWREMTPKQVNRLIEVLTRSLP